MRLRKQKPTFLTLIANRRVRAYLTAGSLVAAVISAGEAGLAVQDICGEFAFNHFYLQPEINFQEQGGKYSRQFIVGDIVYNAVQLDLKYLNVPVLPKYRIAPTNLGL